MSRVSRLATVVVAALVALAMAVPAFASEHAAGQASGEAQVRVAHLSSDAPNVDVYVNGEPVAELQNVPYGTVSAYLPLPEGTQNVQVFAAGDDSEPVIEADVELAAGAAYTIGAVGLVADESLAAQVYEDDLTDPAEGNAKLRAVHASPDAGPVDIVPEGGDPLVEGLEFPNASPYAEVPADTYTLNVNAAGTEEAAITVPDVPVEAGVTYSAFAVGTAEAGDLEVILAEDSGPLPATGGPSLSPIVTTFGAVALLAAGSLLLVRSRFARSRA